VVQQLREAFPFDSAPGYLIFDRGTNFNDQVVDTIRSFSIQRKRTSYKTPWQDGIAERFVGDCRRDLLDHVLVVNEPSFETTDERVHFLLSPGPHPPRPRQRKPRQTQGRRESNARWPSRFDRAIGRPASSIPTGSLAPATLHNRPCPNRLWRDVRATAMHSPEHRRARGPHALKDRISPCTTDQHRSWSTLCGTERPFSLAIVIGRDTGLSVTVQVALMDPRACY
jgi:hypothetical protein